MSDLNQIHTALERLFNEEGHRIVFWNDPEREFQNTLPFIMIFEAERREVLKGRQAEQEVQRPVPIPGA